MNAVFPISPINGLQQPASTAVESQPGRDGEAFAEVLTAALAASTLTGAPPRQQDAAMLGGDLEGNGPEVAQVAETPSPDGVRLTPEGQPAEALASFAGAVSQLRTEAKTQLAVPNEEVAGNGNGQPGHLNAASGLIDDVGNEGPVIDGQTLDVQTTIGTNVDNGAAPKGVDTAADLAGTATRTLIHGAAPGGNFAASDDQALAGPPIASPNDLRRPDANLAYPSPPGATERAPITTTALLMQTMATDGGRRDDTQPGASLANAALSPETRSMRSTTAPILGDGLNETEARLLSTASTLQDNQIDGPPTVPEHRQPSRQLLDPSNRPVEPNLQSSTTPSAVVQPERSPSIVNPLIGNGRAVSTSGAGTRAPVATVTSEAADTDPPIATGQVEGRRQERSLVSAPSDVKVPSSRPLADAATQASIVDVNARQGIEVSGPDRLQPILGAGGEARDVERFEPIADLSFPRTNSPSSHPSTTTQIAVQIMRSIPGGVDRFSVQLHPAELGSVDIQLNFEGSGKLSALITAERPETLELLQRDSRLLERSLGDSGLKLSSDGLSFALKQDQQQQQPGQNFHQQAEAHQTAFRADRAYEEASDIEQASPMRRLDGLRLLDIET